jgi:PhnB protein
MKDIQPYLTFNGNCREAMKFYEKCLGGDLFMQTFADAKMDTPKDASNRIMHAKLTRGSAVLMASDAMPGMELKPGNNFTISIACETVPETEQLFTALSENGKVTMALQETFWAKRFGMFTDRFGIQWMLNLEKPH